jgi:Iap family predicted aminopeptidase
MTAAALAALAIASGGAATESPVAAARAGDSAYAVAVATARAGPRPAASAAERRAHVAMRDRFTRAGLAVEVQRFGVRGRGTSRNVIAKLDTPRTCLRVVMAHTDTTPNAPGANDNASGLGVLAELAARLRDPGCDTWLVATGAEERVYTGSPDHLGALALARLVQRRGLAGRLRWALSLDEVGRDRPFWVRSPVGSAHAGVERELLAAARTERVAASWVRDSGSGNSDHREFELLGMRAMKLGVGRDGEPCRHSPCDRAGRLRASSLRAALLVAERALRRR